MNVLKDIFTDGETLPNGIYVQRKVYWSECEMESWPIEMPWLATINVGGWHYSSKGSATKKQAVSSLLEYMQDMKKQFEDQLKRDNERLKILNEFLTTQSEFCECSYPTADHVSSFNGTCGECGKLVKVY